MKRVNKKNLLIYTLVLLFLGIFFVRFWDDIKNIQITKPYSLIPIVFFVVLFNITNGIINKVILNGYNVPVSFSVALGLSSVNSIGNLLIPMRGGSISNALYLKKKFNFSYGLFLSSLSAIYIIVFWTNSLLGVITMFVQKYLLGEEIPLNLFFFFLIVFIFFSLVILFSPQIPLTRISFFNKFINVINNWKLISKNKNLILMLIALSISNIAIITFSTFYQFQLIGAELNLYKLVIYTIFSGFSLMVSVTPGNIGIRESFSLYSALLLNISLPLVIVVSIVDRAVNFVVSIVLFLFTSGKLSTAKVSTKED